MWWKVASFLLYPSMQKALANASAFCNDSVPGRTGDIPSEMIYALRRKEWIA